MRSRHFVSSVDRARTVLILTDRFSAHALKTDSVLRRVFSVVTLSKATHDFNTPDGIVYGIESGLPLVNAGKSSERHCAQLKTNS